MNATAISAWEKYVGQRFGELKIQFPDGIVADDPRLTAVKLACESWYGLKVLDLGCGRGRYEKYFQLWGAEYIGMDLSAEFIRSGEMKSPRILGSALYLPFPDNAFDVVTIIETLQHSPSPKLALQNAMRIIRPGGTLVVIERNPLALSSDWPLLPAMFVKFIDEYRGRWMYPKNCIARERWITPGRLNSIISSEMDAGKIQYIDSSEQRESRLHRLFARVKPFYCFIAKKK